VWNTNTNFLKQFKMKKTIFLLAILLSVNLFTSCTNDIDEEGINKIENYQNDDYGEDDVADDGN